MPINVTAPIAIRPPLMMVISCWSLVSVPPGMGSPSLGSGVALPGLEAGGRVSSGLGDCERGGRSLGEGLREGRGVRGSVV